LAGYPKTPNECRQRAAECDRLAAEMVDPVARETMLYVAQRQLTLAYEDEGRAPTVSNATAPIPPSDS
jgi:hypothetical protein